MRDIADYLTQWDGYSQSDVEQSDLEAIRGWVDSAKSKIDEDRRNRFVKMYIQNFQ